jgi:hypothetical protein
MTPGGDERGQSTVVGATLLFAIAIIGLGITQAFVVPQQNAAVAQNHWEDADQDMTELRSVIDRAVDRRSSASVAIRLGQRLPDRPFLVEGTPPSGTLETRPVAITIRGQNYTAPVDENGDGTINSTELNGSSPTRELRYTQSGGDWHTLTSFVGPVSTFVKQDGRVSQQVVESGDRIDVLLLKGDVSVGGLRTEEISVEGVSRSCTAIEGTKNPEITVERSGTPDRQIDWSNGDIKTVCLLVVGVNSEAVPDPPRLTPKTGSTGGNNNTLFNPLSPIRFKCADQRGGDTTVVNMTFENTADNATDIDRARIASYQESSGGSEIPDSSDLIDPSGTVVGTLEVAGASVDISPDIEFSPGTNQTVAFDFSGSNPTMFDSIIVRFTTADNRIIRYFVQVKKAGDCNHAAPLEEEPLQAT